LPPAPEISSSHLRLRHSPRAKNRFFDALLRAMPRFRLPEFFAPPTKPARRVVAALPAAATPHFRATVRCASARLLPSVHVSTMIFQVTTVYRASSFAIRDAPDGAVRRRAATFFAERADAPQVLPPAF